jgi:universal stress protein A
VSRYQNILCAVDLSAENVAVSTRAVELADCYGAQVTLLHVVEYIPIDLANELVLPQQQEIEQQLVVQAKKTLQGLAAGSKQTHVEPVVVQGSVKSAIIEYAEEHQNDLIVIGRHGRHGLSRLLGSVANAILHHAPCDVLTIHFDD